MSVLYVQEYRHAAARSDFLMDSAAQFHVVIAVAEHHYQAGALRFFIFSVGNLASVFPAGKFGRQFFFCHFLFPFSVRASSGTAI